MSLSACLLKHKDLLKDFDTSDVKEIARQYEAGGMAAQEAERKAIADKLRELRAEKSRIETDIKAKYRTLDPEGYQSLFPEPAAQEEPLLRTQTRAGLEAIEAQRKADEEAKAKADREAAAQEAKDNERKTVQNRMEGANADFQLGQSAEDNLSGQKPLFSRVADDKVTNSAAFKAWFKDSKVVNPDGSPMVMYHGSPNEFNIFDIGKLNSRSEGPGFYFTNNRDVAAGYGAVKEVFLSIQNPIAYDAKPLGPKQLTKLFERIATLENNEMGGDIRDGFLANYGDTYTKGIAGAVRDAVNLTKDEDGAIDQISGIVGAGVPAKIVLRAFTEVTGYDGIVAKGFSNIGDENNTIFVAFEPNQIKSSTNNKGTFDPSDPNILLSRGSPWYSQMTRQIESLMGNAEPAKQLLLKVEAWAKAGKYKADELQYSGLTDWLKLQEGKVTKQQVLDYLNANGVQVTETVLSKDAPINWSARRQSDGTWQVQANGTDVDVVVARTRDEAIAQVKDSPNLEELMESYPDTRPRGTPKFSQYVLPGGENYRELLLTLPPTPVVDTGESLPSNAVLMQDRGEFKFVMNDGNGAYRYDLTNWHQTPELAMAEYQKGRRIADQQAAKKRDFQSSHFDQPNILAHIRFNERTDADGKRVLFIEELQSDFGQSMKKQKDAISAKVDADFEGIVDRMKKAGVLTVECD
jgi:hypothetical protein